MQTNANLWVWVLGINLKKKWRLKIKYLRSHKVITGRVEYEMKQLESRTKRGIGFEKHRETLTKVIWALGKNGRKNEKRKTYDNEVGTEKVERESVENVGPNSGRLSKTTKTTP